MLSFIDKKLFPGTVSLIQLEDKRIVLPILKNASSTLHKIKVANIDVKDIHCDQTVDVFIRDPWPRFLSGVHTYINKNNLEVETTVKIINDIGYFNLHFCPQLFYIVNLQRFVKCKIRINHVEDLKKITSLNINATKSIDQLNYLKSLFSNKMQLQYYLELDNVLYENFMHSTVDFKCMYETLKTNYSELYNDTIAYSKDIISVLP